MTKSDTHLFVNDQVEQSSSDKNAIAVENISWQAPDALRHYSLGWYVKVSIFFVVIVVVAIWLLESIITAVLFVVVYIALLIYTKKSPQAITYNLTTETLFVNDQSYPLEQFSGFGIIDERDQICTVILLPTARLGTGMTISFKRQDAEQIVDLLGAVLPMRQVEENLIDKLIRRLGL